MSKSSKISCKARGAQALMAAPTTVAGDIRATMPHYDANHMEISNRGLVVLSGAPKVSGYCARIGRTWPVGEKGKFTNEQREIYEMVHFVHNGIIQALKNYHKKAITMDELYRTGVENLKF